MAVAAAPLQPQYRSLHAGVMGMYIFLCSEIMFFGSLFAMYFYMVGSHTGWPPAGTRAVEVWPLPTINIVADLLGAEGRSETAVRWSAWRVRHT